MATMTKKRTSATYGNVAYNLDYMGNVAVERGTAERVYQPSPKVRPRERVRTRTKVQIRAQERVAPFAIVGFLAVAAIAIVVLLSYIQLYQINTESVELRSQLSELKTEEAKLNAQYEKTFDMKEIEESLLSSGTMVQPKSNQVIYLDLSEPDSAVVYGQEDGNSLLDLLEQIKLLVTNAVEYFR
jgi:cell division protein FtsL